MKALADSLASLAHATRQARTALWSALQATQHIGVDRELALGFQDPQVKEQNTAKSTNQLINLVGLHRTKSATFPC